MPGLQKNRIPQLGVAFLTVVADAAVKVVEFSFPLLFLSVRRALGSPCGLLLRAKHLFLAATPQNRVVFSINP